MLRRNKTRFDIKFLQYFSIFYNKLFISSNIFDSEKNAG